MDQSRKLPSCVGIIMDGNRRWAKAAGLSTYDGHKAGYEKFLDACRFVKAAGIRYLVVYAFSTENWNRGSDELKYLETLIEHAFLESADTLAAEDMCMRVIGQRERFSEHIQQRMAEAEAKTERGSYTAAIALSYGGRADIAQSAAKCAAEGITDITEADLARHLWTAGIPDPDLIIRTGGEQRLSNFLTWQSVYSELCFTDTFWPDFSKAEFHAILESYAKRQRRRGT